MSLTLTRRYNVDRFGYLIPYRYGNLPMVGAVATYRPGEGRFGRGAVAVEEGTENLLSQNLSDWSTSGGISSKYDDYGFELVAGGSHPRIMSNIIDCQVGDTFTLSGYIDEVPTDGRGVIVQIQESRQGSGNRDSVPLYIYKPGYFSITGKVVTEGVTTRAVWLRIPDGAEDGQRARFRNVQLEKKPFATSFVDGTRAAGRLTYPAKDIVNPEAGTIHLHLQAPVLDKNWFLWDTSVNRHHAFYRASTGELEIFWNDSRRMSAALPQDKAWHTVTVVWQGEQTSLLIDGEDKATDTIPNGIRLADGELFTLGSRSNYVNQAAKLIDELLILPYAASEEEIVSWYEAQGPLPPHPQALLQWDWQAVRPAQIVKL